MDLARELERAIPDGPPLPPPGARVAAGRIALRRRRLVLGTGAGGLVVATFAMSVALTAGGETSRGVDPVAPPSTTQPPATPEPGPRIEQKPEEAYPWEKDEVAAVDVRSAELMIRPGAVVLERRDDLYPGKDTESVALELRFRGKLHWVELEWDEGGAAGTFGGPEDPFYADFDDFVAKATSGGGMTSGPARGPRRDVADDMPVPATLGWLSVEAGRFEAVPPGRVVDQVRDPDLPDNFALPGTPTAAALVATDSTRYLALFRGREQLVVVEADGHGGTLEELLDWARERYELGVGLL